MSEFIKNNRILIVVLAVLIVLILIRTTGKNHFSPDASKWAEPSFKSANTITPGKLADLKSPNLIINLNQGTDSLLNGISADIKNISAESVLSKENLKTIKKYEGNVLIYCSDRAQAAKVWMVLSQMGRKDLYVLMPDGDNEVLKYNLDPLVSSE